MAARRLSGLVPGRPVLRHNLLVKLFWKSLGNAFWLHECRYECAADNLLDYANIPLCLWAMEDILYSPAWYDVQWCFYLGIQNGDPRVPGTGSSLTNYFSLNDVLGTTPQASDSTRGDQIGARGDLWRIEDSIYTTVGLGTGNYFLTPQGGAKGADASHSYTYGAVNESPGVQAWVD